MNQSIQNLIAKSDRALRSAHSQYGDGDYDFCVSRAYYAMFYLVEALLMTKNLATSRHAGVLNLFYEHFVKTKIFNKSLHQNLHKAYDLRQQGDYWTDSVITADMADEVLKEAGLFSSAVKKELGNTLKP